MKVIIFSVGFPAFSILNDIESFSCGLQETNVENRWPYPLLINRPQVDPSDPVGYSYDHIMKTDALPSTPIHVIWLQLFFLQLENMRSYRWVLTTAVYSNYFVRISLIRVSLDWRIINNVKYTDSMACNQICTIYLNVRLFHNK